MPRRPRHAKKEVEEALADAEAEGWTVIPRSSGHCWGVMRCSESSTAGCQKFIWSTPRSPGDHARDIRRKLHQCPHRLT